MGLRISAGVHNRYPTSRDRAFSVTTPSSPHRIRYGLQTKLILFFGMMLAVLLIMVNMIRIYGLPVANIQGEYAQRQAEIFENLNLVADLKKNTLENWLNERLQDATTLAASRMLRHTITGIRLSTLQSLSAPPNANQSAIPEALQQSQIFQAMLQDLLLFQSTYATYQTIRIVDVSTGIVIASTNTETIGFPIENNTLRAVKSVVEQRQSIGLQAEYDGYQQLFIAQPIMSLDETSALGYLMIDIGQEALAELIKIRSVFNTSSETFLLTKNKQLLASSTEQLPLMNDGRVSFGQLSQALQPLLAQSQQGLLEGMDQHGNAVLAVYRPLQNQIDWGLVVKTNQQESFAPLQRSMFYSFVFGSLLSMVIGLIGTWLLARVISQPLESLANTIQQVQDGFLGARAKISTSDEVGMLAGMFNNMLDRLQRSKNELEEIIEARTTELRTTNFSLAMTLEEMKDLNTDLETQVAEKEKAKTILRRKQLEQQIIFDSMPAYMWYKDTAMRVVWMNKPAERLVLTNSATQDLTQALNNLVSAEDKRSASIEDQEVIQSGQSKLGIIRQLRLPNGDSVWIQAEKVPFINEHDETIGVIVMATDITARVNAEKARQESEVRFGAIIETAVDGIIMIDQDGVIQLVNPSLTNMFGYEDDELLQQSVGVLMPSPDRDRHHGYMNHYLSNKTRHIIGLGREVMGLKKNGEQFPIHLAVSELKIDGKILFAGIISDITELKQAQQQLQDSKKALERQNHAYRRFVPKEFLSFLGKESIVDVELGDQVQKDMTILFSDIRDFTRLSETMTPNDNFRFINAYLSKMEPMITEHDGFIDKYIGDSIMALFPNDPDDAVRSAIAMLNVLHGYNADRLPKGYQQIDIGIGIHTGSMMLGTVGGTQRMDSTVISDAVNLASRMEGLTKLYGSTLLLTEHTFNELSDSYQIRIVDKVKVKGKSEAVIVFEVLDGCPSHVRDFKLSILNDFTMAFTAYQRRHFIEAEEGFAQCLAIYPDDKASKLYLKRSQFMQRYGDDPSWQGVTELETKNGMF